MLMAIVPKFHVFGGTIWGEDGRFEEVGFLGISGSVSREAICASN